MRLLGACAVVALTSGCGMHYTPSPRMGDSAPGALAPAADAATLVFVRPSAYAGVWNPSIYIDGRYAADVEAERQVVVKVPPGQHVIIGALPDFAKACRQMVATVEPGKIYFVETSVASGADLFAARPSDAPKLKTWLERAPITRKLADGAASPLEAKDLSECFKKAAEHLADDSDEDKAKHTVRGADGFTTPP